MRPEGGETVLITLEKPSGKERRAEKLEDDGVRDRVTTGAGWMRGCWRDVRIG
jgi:hypothetical protein